MRDTDTVLKSDEAHWRKAKAVLLYSLVFWMAGHGYRFVNNLYTGDTLGSVFQDDILWQRSLGRFMQPVSMIFRGVIVSPWLLALISILFFAGSVYLISELLKLEDRAMLLILCGVLACNNTVTCALAAYTPWIDIYMTAFFLAVFGVYLFRKDKPLGYIAGMICFALCMGFYQAYISVAFVLFAILFIFELSCQKPDRVFALRVIKTVAFTALSGGLYFIMYKLILKIHHVEEAVSYNSLSNLGSGAGVSLGHLITGAYGKYFYYLMHQGTFVSTYLLGKKVSDAWDALIMACVSATIVMLLAGLVIINIKNKTTALQRILQVLILVCFPLFSNVIYILSGGMEYELMIFAFYFLYVFFIAVLMCGVKKQKLKYLMAIPLAILIWHSVVFSNQVYLKIDMEDRAALSFATRIADDINDMEGYVPGVTPVRILGLPEASGYYEPVIYLRDVIIHGNFDTPFNYESSFPFYMTYYLNERINFSQAQVPSEVSDSMPEYPQKGSIAFVDDVLVIKLSE